jgi:hypothetical protein
MLGSPGRGKSHHGSNWLHLMGMEMQGHQWNPKVCMNVKGHETSHFEKKDLVECHQVVSEKTW